MTLPDPLTFVRAVTGALALVWSVRGLWRGLCSYRSLERRLFGGPWRAPAWFRRAALHVLLRTTVLDPLNLALMLALCTVWVFGAA